MTRTRTRAAILVVLLMLTCVPSVAFAQVQHTVRLFYWVSNGTVTRSGAANGTWSTPFWGIDYRAQSLASPWGFHLNYVAGSEGNFGGSIAGSGSGSDSILSGDVTYALPMQAATVWGFLGFGSISGQNSASSFRSSGPRIGADVRFPVAANFVVNAGVAYYPSNTTTVSGIASGSASAGATDYTISLQFTTATQFTIEGGYRSTGGDSGAVGAGCPCNWNWSGFFLAIGRTLP